MGFSYQAALAYDHTKCGTADSLSFPALIYGSHTTLKDISHGGYVSSSAGADILVFSDSALTTQLPTEIDYYDNVNGILWLWVQIGTLSHSTNGTVYLAVGNATPPARTANPWDANYKGVWHFSTGTMLKDSSSSAYNLTNHSATSITGIIDGGAGGFPTPATLTSPALTTISGANTFSFWVKVTSDSNYQIAFSANSTGPELWAASGGGGDVTYLGSVNNSHATGVIITDGAWHQLAAGFNGSSNVLVYIDGALKGSFSQSAQSISSFTLGDRVGNTSYPVNGSMDEVRLSSTNRSADWIKAEYNNQFSPGNIGAAGFWTWGAWSPVGSGQPMTLMGVGA